MKKIIVFLLCIAVCLIFVGCSLQNETTPTKQQHNGLIKEDNTPENYNPQPADDADDLAPEDDSEQTPETEVPSPAPENDTDGTEDNDGLTFELIGSGYSVKKYEGTSGKVVIPDEYDGIPVTEIGQNAFYACVTLTEITLPKSLQYIDCYSFYFCRNLKTINYGGTMAEWQDIQIDNAFNCNTTVICSDGTTNI